MNVLNYFIEANLGVIACFVMYECLLARETNFHLQRLYLLCGLGTSLVFPLLDFSSSVFNGGAQSTPLIMPEVILTADASNPSFATSPDLSLARILWLIYLSGVVVLLIPVVIQMIKLFAIRFSASGRYEGSSFIIESNRSPATYSFFNLIVVGKADQLSEEEKKLVILHEQSHNRMLHTLDVLAITVLCIVFWFNPLAWMCRQRLIRVHEFQADRVAANAVSPSAYALVLAKSAMLASGLNLTHHISKSFILKRIDMINQLQKRVGSWKLLTLVTVTIAFAVVVSCTDQVSQAETGEGPDVVPPEVIERLTVIKKINPEGLYEARPLNAGSLGALQENSSLSLEYLVNTENNGMWAIVNTNRLESKILTVVDQPATPTGGFADYYRRLGQALTYPHEARRQGIEGRVIVEFVVQPDGRLSDFKVLRGLGGGCDAAAMQAIMETTGWTPGMQNGSTVAQRVVLPITFQLQ